MIETTLIDYMGTDLSVVNAARVSFGKESDWEFKPDKDSDFDFRLSTRDTELIEYLAKHKHMSPFGHAFASFHVKAPIFVARQLVKHKFLRWNEISRRYVDDEPEFYEPEVWRGRSEDRKQGSEGVVGIYDGEWTCIADEFGFSRDRALEAYNELLGLGVCPEQARMVLPQSTMTEWYWSGSLDAFASMCKLRCAPDTQHESRLVANQIAEVMGKLFPVSWKELMKQGEESG